MLFNAVVVSVLVMVILSLLRINVIFALLMAALTAGIVSGMSLSEATDILVDGMANQSGTALSYILLGIFAVMIGMSGITTILVNKMLKVFSNKRIVLVLSIAGIGIFSQNLVPVHIAFIPILIPPLLGLFNKLQIDRRAVATALTFALKFPYITIPFGFGFIFQGIIKDEMIDNGMQITSGEVTKAMLFPGAAMIVGLLIAVLITYRKKRIAKPVIQQQTQDVSMADSIVETKEVTFNVTHFFTIVAIIAALVLQIITDSLILGALVGIIVMFVTRVVKLYQGDLVVNDGIGMMGMIAFVMLIASGYAKVLTESGAVDELVKMTLNFTGDSKFVIAVLLLSVGLVITLGIGTSFGTIPILAALYIPILLATGMSPMASAALIGSAAALGDAGSPASDSTLAPTAGLNYDGKHHHIWDTCVPTFLHYNIPLFIFGVVGAMVL